MSKEKEIKESKETPALPVEPVKETPAAPAAPISIMGEPKAAPKSEETVTIKAFADLKSAVEQLGTKIDGFIPKSPTQTPVAPEPKKYRLFDEFEVI